MTKESPLVSVLMTAYNREKYIGEAIESVLASTYKNFELIVVDDCSTDSTRDIVQSHAKNDDRIKFYKNKKNLGDYPNRNKAASYAKGKYIKYLDSDDIIYPHGLAVMSTMMEAYPEAGYGLSQCEVRGHPHPQLLSPEEAYSINFFEQNLFGRAPGSSFISTAAFRRVGGFSGWRHVSDHQLWIRLSREYNLVTMPRDLVWDRTHDDQEKGRNLLKKLTGHLTVQEEALFHPACPLSEEDRGRAWQAVLNQYRHSFWRKLLREKQLKCSLDIKQTLGFSWMDLILGPGCGRRGYRYP